ncbi:MAG: hydroxyacylglutathione hydrolase [Clostridia bacterium]|nr:hydroxyacylglutathione hydrolase [Deltaproteobacteria bacterium]
MLAVRAIPVLEDNYVWLITRGREAAVVDPGEAGPVLDVIHRNHLRLEAILVTHHHDDHVGGVSELASLADDVPTYASGADAGRLDFVNHAVADGDRIIVLGESLKVIATPGHTRGALCYYGAGMLFTGDTVFGAGCGRLFEGSPEQMFASLQKLADLPDDTKVYAGHEYTEKNLMFAATVEPDNHAVRQRLAKLTIPSLPSTLALERATNPFLRSRNPTELAERRKRRDSF